MDDFLTLLKSLFGDSEGESPASGELPEVPSAVTPEMLQEGKESSGASKGLDRVQGLADLVGVADQSGLTDGINSLVSMVRGLTSQDSEERVGHFKDAGIRALSMIPIVGDFAKVGRTGKYMDEVADLGSSLKGLREPAAEGADTLWGKLSGIFKNQDVAKYEAIESDLAGERSSLSSMRDILANLTSENISEQLAKLRGSRDEAGAAAITDPDLKKEQERIDLWRKKLTPEGFDVIEIPPDPTESSTGYDVDRPLVDPAEPQEEPKPAGFLSRIGSTLLSPLKDLAEGFKEQDVKKITSGLGKIAAVMVAVPPLMEKFGELMKGQLREFGIFDGGTAAALAHSDVRGIQRNMQMGRATSVSSQELIEQVEKFKDDDQSLKEFGQNVSNELASFAIWAARGVVILETMALEITGVKPFLEYWFEWEKGKEQRDQQNPHGQALMNFFNDPNQLRQHIHLGRQQRKQPMEDLE